MISLKKCNYFTGSTSHVANAVSKIVKFLELDGYNHLLITPPKSSSSKESNSGIFRDLPGYLEFRSYDDFEKLISDRSNLFRINLIIFDFWYFSIAEISSIVASPFRILISLITVEYFHVYDMAKHLSYFARHGKHE